MNRPQCRWLPRLLAFGVALPLLACLGGASPPRPPKVPAQISISVDPETVEPGGQARVSLSLAPIDGVKINRYPKIKLQVPPSPGLVQEAEASMGNSAPPPPGKTESNYFETVDPLTLDLSMDPSAGGGKHEIDAKLTYFYCIPASGFCAPKRIGVKIPITVR